jgi:hypothetical protein
MSTTGTPGLAVALTREAAAVPKEPKAGVFASTNGSLLDAAGGVPSKPADCDSSDDLSEPSRPSIAWRAAVARRERELLRGRSATCLSLRTIILKIPVAGHVKGS